MASEPHGPTAAMERARSVHAGFVLAGSVHVACFEECGATTLERIAREARPGDAALLLGPAGFEAELRRHLEAEATSESAQAMRVIRIGRMAGRWPGASIGIGPLRLPMPAGGRAIDAARSLAAGTDGRGAMRFLAYGSRARAFVRARLDADCERAGVPEDLPAAPLWPEGRRARIRRELGLSARDVALLVGAEPSEWTDLGFVARAVGMAIVAGAPLRLVVAPATPRTSGIAAFLRGATGSAALHVDPRAERPWELLPALDGAIVEIDGASSRPDLCRGSRSRDLDGVVDRAVDREIDRGSPLPALWSLACGLPTFAHAALDLGAHAANPRLARFDSAVAPFAHALVGFAREVQAMRARNPTAASR